MTSVGHCEHGHECLICRSNNEHAEQCPHGLVKKALCVACIAARYEGLPGRILTEDEAAFCTRYGFSHGYDDDNPELEQYSHICWPYLTRGGAICGSPRLWHSGEGWGRLRLDGKTRVPHDDFVSCDACIAELGKLQAGDHKLLELVATAERKACEAWSIASAARDYVWGLDNPGEFGDGDPGHGRDALLTRLRQALAADPRRSKGPRKAEP